MTSQEERDSGKKNWFESIGSKLTEGLWKHDPADHRNSTNEGKFTSNGNTRLTPEQFEQLKEYMSDPTGWRTRQEAKNIDRNIMRDNLRIFDRIVEQERNERRREAMESAAEMGLTRTWDGGYKDDYGNKYDEFGQPK